MSEPQRSDKPLPRLTEHLRTLLRGLYGGINDGLYGELDRIDAYATATECSADAALLRQLVLDCQNDLAEYIVPDSGVTEHEVVSKLLGRLDGPQSRAALAAQSASTASKEERAWLIEMPGARWGTGYCWKGITEYGVWGTVEEAVRFARKEDAERVIESLRQEDMRRFGRANTQYEACEHVWSDGVIGVSAPAPKRCERCEGTGAILEKCGDGSGESLALRIKSVPCNACYGRGVVDGKGRADA